MRTDPWRRVRVGAALLVGVVALGTLGYALLGLSAFDALYQTVTTVTTIGFKEVGDFTTADRAFTIVVALAGVGTALYTFTAVLEVLVEGHLSDLFGRRRMQSRIAGLSGHVIVCGWGRVGRTIGQFLAGAGRELVVVDRDADRLVRTDAPYVVGDATDDDVLAAAGLDRASVLVAALDADAANLYVTLSARAVRPDLFIVVRARVPGAEAKLLQAGADRVVNPQHIGGARMAALALQPHVADFLDVVMHDGSLEFRLGEVTVPAGSALAGSTIREAEVRERTGALVLAVRDPTGAFGLNPGPDDRLEAGQVLIVIGTRAQLDALTTLIGSTGRR
ncbi:MAG: potassium channel protein [Acidimicrobiales bacterium]|nr:potassium channel protein [Acidimicrobiales bacterium]